MRRVIYFLTQPAIEREVKEQIRKDEGIIYGGQSIKKQIGIFSRPTQDYDVFVSNPKRSAYETERRVEKFTPEDDFYVKKGVNKTTYKVKYKGDDGKANTPDDESVVDFTRTPSPKPKTVMFDGLMYRSVNEELKAKQKILRDPTFGYRHQKDREDIERINLGSGRLNLKRTKF